MEDLETQIDERRGRAIRKAILIIGLCTVPALLLGGIPGPLVAFVAYIVYRKAIQGEYIILWLRNFSRTDKRALNLSRILADAGTGIGVPVTIQDRSYRHSLAEPLKYLLMADLLFGVVAVLTTISALACAFFVTSWMRMSDQSGGVIFLGVAVVFLSGGAWMIFRYVRLLGCTRLNQSDWKISLECILEDIQDRKKARTGVLVIECGNSFWREAVRRALDYAHAVVLDVSDISENLAWETKTVFEYLPPESVILAFPFERKLDERIPREHLVCQIDQIIGDGLAKRCQFFRYERRRMSSISSLSYLRAKGSQLNGYLLKAIRSSISARSLRDTR